MTQLAFIDTETTGLDPHRHRIWEAAVILADHEPKQLQITDRRQWFVRMPAQVMQYADATALRMTRFHARTNGVEWTEPEPFTRDLAFHTAGRHLVGAVPSFDERRLDDLLRAHGQAPAWHYHLIDVEALAAGALAGIRMMDLDPDGGSTGPRPTGAPPWRSDDLAAAFGVETPADVRHTAMGDTLMALRVYAAVYDLTIVGLDQ